MGQTANTIDSLEASVLGKVKEIIEQQWGKQLADIRELYIGRFYERLMQGEIVSYRSTNRYVLRMQFTYAREPRHTLFRV